MFITLSAMASVGLIAIIAVIAIIILLVIANIKIVPQSKAYVIERLGAYFATWDTGLHVKIPFIEKVAKVVSLKEQVVDFPPQPVITKDNVTMQIDTVVFFQITDPKLYAYGVERPLAAIENLTATTLRNIIGEMELDNTLTSRDIINAKISLLKTSDYSEKEQLETLLTLFDKGIITKAELLSRIPKGLVPSIDEISREEQ